MMRNILNSRNVYSVPLSPERVAGLGPAITLCVEYAYTILCCFLKMSICVCSSLVYLVMNRLIWALEIVVVSHCPLPQSYL